MSCYQINIKPRDILFFRDARPISGSSIGNGCNWPLPSVFHSAMMSAFYAKWHERQDWEVKHLHRRDKKDKNFETSKLRFGGLKTAGPFPCINGEIYFPAPADLVKATDNFTLMQPSEMSQDFSSNLPLPLKYPVVSFAVPSKESVNACWISSKELTEYLNGNIENLKLIPSKDLYSSESRPGVGINPETHSNIEKVFYQASYMRLNELENVSISAFVECLSGRNGSDKTDLMEKFFASDTQIPFILGGQRALANIETARNKNSDFNSFFKFSQKNKSVYIKWILLSPAVFSGGWLPGWIDGNSGNVMLKPKDHFGTAFDINASLVAARINKPFPFSGWELDMNKDNAGGSPKKTYMAVPAGSVYYFTAESPEAAEKLIMALSYGQRRSDFFGEQGFGIGVCSNYELKNFNHNNN